MRPRACHMQDAPATPVSRLFTDRDHTGLDADPAGRWLLYLSGNDLFVSLEGSAPFLLTPGLIAAA